MAAAARTSGRNGGEPGECSMTSHGMVQTSASGHMPAVTHPRVSMAIADANRRPSRPVPARQYNAVAQRGGLSASSAALPDEGRNIGPHQPQIEIPIASAYGPRVPA